MARKIKARAIHGSREPREGELSFELQRILKKHCGKKPFKHAVKSIQLAVARLAPRFNFNEYEVEYDRSTSLTPTKPWVNESVQILIFRKRSNRTLSIYRAGATSYPHFFPGPEGRYANLSAPRDMTIYSTVDEQYSWEKLSCKKPRASLIAKWNRK